MIILKDKALVRRCKTVSGNTLTERDIAKYNDDFYWYDDLKRVFVRIDDCRVINKLKNLPMFDSRAEEKSVYIEYMSTSYINNNKAVNCFLENQDILFKIPSFCEYLFLEFNVEKLGSVEAVDVVRESYLVTGFPEKMRKICDKISNNSFLNKAIIVELAVVLSFGTQHVPNEILDSFFRRMYISYPTELERKVFFTAVSCLNNEVIANRLFILQRKLTKFKNTRTND